MSEAVTLRSPPSAKEVQEALEAHERISDEEILRFLSRAFCPPSLPTLPKMTYEAFLAWADEDTLAEWIALPGTDKGEIVMTSPASNKHQDLVRFLVSILGIYVEQKQIGIVRPAPFQMKLEHGREPDLLYVAQAHLDRVKPTYLDGPADLVVEIISPESIARDRGEKYYEYARGGVPEYWLIDPQAEWCEFYQLKEGHHYQLAMEGNAGEYHSAVLTGFWLKIEWLWQTPLPPVLKIAQALELVK